MPEFSDKSIWLLAREYEGWIEAGGVKDVVHDMTKAFVQLGWEVHICLPLHGFLKTRVFSHGKKTWVGKSCHPLFNQKSFECWDVGSAALHFHFLRTPSFETKNGVYTVTVEEEDENMRNHGSGYPDTFQMNLEFQWAVVEYWRRNSIRPSLVLSHDGHCGFISAIAKASPLWNDFFTSTSFFLLIHNAGQGYRQEMPCTEENKKLLHLPQAILDSLVWEQTWDPLVFSAQFGKLATVSENYAQELLTGTNDFYSGSFGRFLREFHIPLEGITNGFDTSKHDPRFPHRSGLPFSFDPSRGDWKGKDLCRCRLVEELARRSKDIYGSLKDWKLPLYVFQSRLTGQKGVDDLKELIEAALTSSFQTDFLVMGVGEERYEQTLLLLARQKQEEGRFLFVNTYEEDLAKLVFASADFFLMPSVFEPCGLTDLKAQLMGALPIVAKVGGLVKIRDGDTGFSYERNLDQGLWGAYTRTWTLLTERRDLLEKMKRQAFRSCLSEYRWTDILQNRYLPWFSKNP